MSNTCLSIYMPVFKYPSTRPQPWYQLNVIYCMTSGHHEEVSTLALQHDCQVLASASGAHKLSTSQVILWDLQTMSCKKVLKHHSHDIVCLAYSRDDRFLISVGEYSLLDHVSKPSYSGSQHYIPGSLQA